MICPKCGIGNADTRTHCRKCQMSLRNGFNSVSSSESSRVSYQEEASQGNWNQARTQTDSSFGETEERPKPRKFFYGVLIFMSLLVSAGAFYLFNPDETKISSLYFQAESLYKAERYNAALVIYRKILVEHSGSELARLSKKKIQEIYYKLKKEEFQENEVVDELLTKAEAAYRRNHLFIPKADNVMWYLAELESIDPDNGRSLELQHKVIRLYEKKMAKAFHNNNFQLLKKYCNRILIFFPDNRSALYYQQEIKQISDHIASENHQKMKRQQASQKENLEETVQLQVSEEKDFSEYEIETPDLMLKNKKSLPKNNALSSLKAKSPVSREIARAIARQKSKWFLVLDYVQENIQVLKATQEILILHHRKLKQSIVVSTKRTPQADIYAATEQKRGGNPYLVWAATPKFANNYVLPRKHWKMFFNQKFIRSLRLPE